MKNKEALFFCILLVPVLATAVGLSDPFSSAKKHSLSGLKQKIEQKQVQKQTLDDFKNMKKSRKNPSLLTRAIQYIENKKQSFVKKTRLFYRRHFYISVISLGLLSVLSLYCLNMYGVPFFHDLIKKYKQSQGVITQGSHVPETIQKNPIHDSASIHEVVNKPETLSKPLHNQELIQEPGEQDVADKKSELVEKVVTQDAVQSSNQKVEICANQEAQTQTTALPLVQADLSFSKIRSPQQINESTTLYTKTKNFINKTLTDQINHFKKLKNEYEVAKKRVKESPCNIQLHKDSLKKEQAVIEYKKKIMQATQESAQKIDSSDFLNQYGIVRELTEDDLGKPRKAVITDKRSVAFEDAANHEVYYGNVINKNREENFKKALAEQQKQHQEFNYMRGVLNKVLLPFVESL